MERCELAPFLSRDGRRGYGRVQCRVLAIVGVAAEESTCCRHSVREQRRDDAFCRVGDGFRATDLPPEFGRQRGGLSFDTFPLSPRSNRT